MQKAAKMMFFFVFVLQDRNIKKHGECWSEQVFLNQSTHLS